MRLNRIGLSRYIALEWLNETARATKEFRDPEQVKEVLQNTIDSHEGKEAKRKTIDVLTRTWARVEDEHVSLRDEALDIFDSDNSIEKIMLHWGLLLLAYPIFRDVTESIGKLSNLQGYVTISQVKRSIKKDWGDRTTLNKTVDRIFQSLVEWNVLQGTDGSFKLNKKICASKVNVQKWLLTSLLQSIKPRLVSSDDLLTHSSLFPFSFDITIKQLTECSKIEIINQGSNIYMVRIV